MTVSNQKPVILSANYTDNIQNDFDPIEITKQAIVDKLTIPLVSTQPVKITENGKPFSNDDIAELIIRCCGDHVDVSAEQTVKALLGQTLVNYNPRTAISVVELFAVQSGTAAKLPEPDANVIYTPAADVIPMSRQFLAGTCSYDAFFASLAYYARPETLGFYFANDIAFSNFIQWFAQQMSMLSGILTPEVNNLAADFMKLTLPGLTEAIILRDNDSDDLEPLSFSRLVLSLLMQYGNAVSPAEFGILPFNVGELLCPKTIVFVNVERHSRASAREVAEEWNLINKSLQMKQQPKMISNKSLRRLTAVQRNLQKIAVAATAASNQRTQIAQAANIRFAKTRPTNVDIVRLIQKIMSKMACANKSMNTYKSVKATFAKPNRRDPDNYNKQGKMVSTKYKPDIHLYIDTSGSITERDYEDAVKACIAMAKKLNINMYFNSFSHVLSQTTRLHLEGKSSAAIYAEFQKAPKVTGGTDYEQIWHFINKSKKRLRELSIIITDFGYDAPTRYVRHPKNLYYIPCSTIKWDRITYWAAQFCKSAMHNDPNIRDHILF